MVILCNVLAAPDPSYRADIEGAGMSLETLRQSARKCCPHCNSTNIHKNRRTYSYICQSCENEIKSYKQLRRCPACNSRYLTRQRVPAYVCYKCWQNFDIPALKNVKCSIGRLPSALLPKKGVQA